MSSFRTWGALWTRPGTTSRFEFSLRSMNFFAAQKVFVFVTSFDKLQCSNDVFGRMRGVFETPVDQALCKPQAV